MVRPACFRPVGRRAGGAAGELGRGGRRRRPDRRRLRLRGAPGVPWGADRASSVPVVRAVRVRPVGRRTGGFAGGAGRRGWPAYRVDMCPPIIGRLPGGLPGARPGRRGAAGRRGGGRARWPAYRGGTSLAVQAGPSRAFPSRTPPARARRSMRTGGAVWRKCDMARRIWSRAGFACCLPVAPMATFAALLDPGSYR